MKTTGGCLPDVYGLNERFIILRLPEGSPLAGRSLSEIRLGSLAGLQAITVIRNGRPRPRAGTRDSVSESVIGSWPKGR